MAKISYSGFELIIALDGPSGSGKSSTAQEVAKRLNLLYLNTGAMYRGITLKALENQIKVDDKIRLIKLAQKTSFGFDQAGHLLIDSENPGDLLISPEVSNAVSDYCQIKEVREILTEKQRVIGQSRDCILDGRDIGTVVFPHADLKFFLVADYGVRAERRQKELLQKGIQQSLEEIEKNLRERDQKDSARKEAPLRKADDAIEIDTTQLSFNQQVERICEQAGVVASMQMADAQTPESK